MRAGDADAETELLDLWEIALLIFEPGKPLEEYAPEMKRFVGAVRSADALLLGTAAYHGTLAGVPKNALDFAQFVAHDEKPYFDNKVVGLIASLGGPGPEPTRSPRWYTPCMLCAAPGRR